MLFKNHKFPAIEIGCRCLAVYDGTFKRALENGKYLRETQVVTPSVPSQVYRGARSSEILTKARKA